MTAAQGRRTAIVLLQLGGPRTPEGVEPFLRALFSDPAIIRLPWPFRQILAGLIARRRAPIAREIYEKIGGGSPILEETEAQASALEEALVQSAAREVTKVFVAMRYSNPRSEEAAREIAAFAPDRVVALPLYPQFSTTTSQSSLGDLRAALAKANCAAPFSYVCCYPQEAGFIGAQSDAIRWALREARVLGTPRLLFSAHGLPERIVRQGDPYPWQVEQTAAAILRELGEAAPAEAVVCYQSRVGPLKWIGPATEDEIHRAGAEGRVIVIAPIAFVSEHSETLVELDMEYRDLAEKAGAKGFIRVPTVRTTPLFIEGLARLAMKDDPAADGCLSPRICPASAGACPNRRAR